MPKTQFTDFGLYQLVRATLYYVYNIELLQTFCIYSILSICLFMDEVIFERMTLKVLKSKTGSLRKFNIEYKYIEIAHKKKTKTLYCLNFGNLSNFQIQNEYKSSTK